MRADPLLCSLLIRIIAVIEYHHLHIAKNVFHWIIIWACFGQADPVQFQLSHRVPSDSRFARVRTVLIQSEPHVFGLIPTTHLLHKMAYVFGTLAIQVFPSHLPRAFIVEQEQIELPASLLTKRQHQALFARVAASTVGFDEDRFDIKEQQDSVFWKMLSNQTDSAQNRLPLGVIADDFAPDSAKVESPFLSNRRRCSWLMAFTTRCLSRYWRSFSTDQRP